jgi:hypothetical protein
LDAEAREKLKLLELQASMSTSDVLRDAIDLLFEQRATAVRDRHSVLSSLIGTFKGPPNLSEDYKKLLATSLAAKHGDA